MPIGILFWALMIIWLVFGLVSWRAPNLMGGYGWLGNGLFLWFLLFLLGWGEYGFILQGGGAPFR